MEDRIPKELVKPIIETYPKGAYIYKTMQPVLYIYFVIEGQVKIETSCSSGRQVTKSILSHGAIFGEMGLFGEKIRIDDAYALDDAVIHIYPVREIQQVLKLDSTFQYLLLSKMANQVINLEQRYSSLVFKDSRTRVIEFLVQLGRREGQRIGFDTLLKNFLPHQEIAFYIATSRQTVNTVLNELKAQNLIYYRRKRLLIRDIDKLEEMILCKKNVT